MYLESNLFLEALKLAEISPVFKKKNELAKENHSFLNVISHVSKVIVYNQNDNFINNKLSDPLIDFGKNHSTQHCSMCRLEIWKATWIKEVHKSFSLIKP